MSSAAARLQLSEGELPQKILNFSSGLRYILRPPEQLFLIKVLIEKSNLA